MKNLKFQSVFDIISPVMVGPSSSHTAGAVRIGKIVSAIFGDAPTEV
ncbi:MAG: L-serine ammonia-lyase, iron-sulfur-dependent, subunit beta, partial [Streptococcus thermophilus]|nr:L-serine ammonia-lyase, iron-sulfur-dependent, subunit beta [Streptococcus thermophilus]